MSDLKPCPFCGGVAECHQWWSATISGKYATVCTKCNCGTDFYATEAEAIAAWNTRADDYERAAEYWQRMYEQTFAERTCRDTGENEWHFVCSACGYEQNGYECWNYCSNCGAKVIERKD